MTRSWREIPHYHVGCEIVVEEPLRALEAFNRDRPVNERVLFAAVLLRAVAQAASDTPTLNGRFENGVFQPADAVQRARTIERHPHDAALLQVAEQVATHSKPGTFWVDTSTVSPTASATAAHMCAAAGIEHVRTTVSGNNKMAEAAQLTVLAMLGMLLTAMPMVWAFFGTGRTVTAVFLAYLVVITAAIGWPLPIGLPMDTASGTTPWVSNAHQWLPTRPKPTCTSSARHTPPSARTMAYTSFR